MNTTQKYILIYGQRRLEACKKIGWKTIPALIDKNKLIDADIKEIVVLENTRIRIEEDELGELMEDIKHRGLLEPIGITARADFSEEKFLTDNVAENIHRKDISPIELAKVCKRLSDKGYSISEIAVALSKPIDRIRKSLILLKRLPEEYHKDLVYQPHGVKMKEGIPATVGYLISTMRVNDKLKKEIVELVKKNELSVSQLNLLAHMVAVGLTVKKAFKEMQEHKIINFVLVANNKVMEKYGIKNPTKFVREVLKGDREPIKELFI